MTVKGSADYTGATDEHAIKLIIECLERCKNDVLNIKDDEFNSVTNLVNELGNRLNKYKKKSILWDIVKPSLTAKQNMKVIESELE